MKASKYLILIIGILGVIASGVSIYNGAPVADVIFGFISSIALIYAFFLFDRFQDQKENP
jgi:uncharacterized membrane protein (DUF4010 family)